MEEEALAALDVRALARDAADLVRVPSITGDDTPRWSSSPSARRPPDSTADLHQHDLAALRAHPDHPGEEAPRDELWGVTATLAGDGGRLCLNGHVDVVGPGTEPWEPWSGAIDDGRLHGRGVGRHEGRGDRRAARARRPARRRRADARGRAPGRRLRGGRRARDVRRPAARRGLRRGAAARADRPARRLRAGGRADLQAARSAAARRTPRSGSRASRRSTATCACTRRWPRTRRRSTPPSRTR